MTWRGTRPPEVTDDRPYVCKRGGRWLVLSVAGDGGYGRGVAAAMIKCGDYDEAQQVARQWAGFRVAWDTEVTQ